MLHDFVAASLAAATGTSKDTQSDALTQAKIAKVESLVGVKDAQVKADIQANFLTTQNTDKQQSADTIKSARDTAADDSEAATTHDWTEGIPDVHPDDADTIRQQVTDMVRLANLKRQIDQK